MNCWQIFGEGKPWRIWQITGAGLPSFTTQILTMTHNIKIKKQTKWNSPKFSSAKYSRYTVLVAYYMSVTTGVRYISQYWFASWLSLVQGLQEINMVTHVTTTEHLMIILQKLMGAIFQKITFLK